MRKVSKWYFTCRSNIGVYTVCRFVWKGCNEYSGENFISIFFIFILRRFPFAGATCPNGSMFLPKVAGSKWIPFRGVYSLQSCPPGYELVSAAEECILCPAFFFCPGGSVARSSCPGGLFASPGSASQSSCYKAVFVVVAFDFSVSFDDFSDDDQSILQSKLASLAGFSSSRDVVIDSIFSLTAVLIRTVVKIATPDAAAAARLSKNLGSDLVNKTAFTARGLPDASLHSITVTGCTPGLELLTSASSLAGTDGKCSMCPAAYYCTGGVGGRSACPSGTFSPPGSNSSRDCSAAVFVLMSVLLPIPYENFTESIELTFVQAVALASKTQEYSVIVTEIAPSPGGRRAGFHVNQFREERRAGTTETLVKTQIAAADSGAATAIADSLNTAALNSALISKGLPHGSVQSVSVSTLITSTDVQTWVIAISIIGAFIFLLLIGVAIWLSMRSKESSEELILRLAVTKIRQELKITKKDGYFLGSERPSYSSWTGTKEALFLRRNHLEAAARLELGQDFDVSLFDAFCLSLERETKTESEDRYLALGEWLLRISEGLIRPELLGRAKGARSNSAALKFRFFVLKVGKAKIWNDNPMLFTRLQQIAHKYLNDIGEQCETRYISLCAEPSGDELITFQAEKPLYENVASKINMPATRIQRSSRHFEFTTRLNIPSDSKKEHNKKTEFTVLPRSRHRVSVTNRQDSDEVRSFDFLH
jgi:hypothetical protein